jgi:hypothetical protein
MVQIKISHNNKECCTMQLLREILEKAAQAQPADVELLTKSEVARNEVVVGVLPEELRGLYLVMCSTAVETDAVADQLEAEHRALLAEGKEVTNEQMEGMNRRYRIASNRFDTVKNMFWGAVKRAFPELITKEAIGLRKDWEVVYKSEYSGPCADCDERNSCPSAELARTLGDRVCVIRVPIGALGNM